MKYIFLFLALLGSEAALASAFPVTCELTYQGREELLPYKVEFLIKQGQQEIQAGPFTILGTLEEVCPDNASGGRGFMCGGPTIVYLDITKGEDNVLLAVPAYVDGGVALRVRLGADKFSVRCQ